MTIHFTIVLEVDNKQKDTNFIKEKLDSHINEIHQAGIKEVLSIGHHPR